MNDEQALRKALAIELAVSQDRFRELVALRVDCDRLRTALETAAVRLERFTAQAWADEARAALAAVSQETDPREQS